MDQNLQSFCAALPKVELHAHLNGSFSGNTLKNLCSMSPSLRDDHATQQMIEDFTKGEIQNLEECFKIFGVAHAVTTSPLAVMQGTEDVVKEFAADGVIYLEIRTTPRAVSGVMSKKEYIEAVLNGIRKASTDLNSSKQTILVKLLISVNRRESLAEAHENIEEAVKAHSTHPDYVVGVDLSGNPSFGNFAELLPLFAKARLSGLKVALHCGEVPNEDEIEAMLKFKADRLGHGTCIHPSNGGSIKLWNLFCQTKTPLEVCLTSNVKCKTVQNYEDHHLQYLFHHHPFAISTDDKGVFSTSLSREYAIAAKTFHFSSTELYKCVEMSIEASFASSEEKNKLFQELSAFKLRAQDFPAMS